MNVIQTNADLVGNPLIEEMSHTLYDAFAVFRTSAGLKAVPWEETSEVTQKVYFSAIATLLAAHGPKVFGRESITEPRHLTRLERLSNWLTQRVSATEKSLEQWGDYMRRAL